MLAKHIGVDLGTVNVLVWVKGKGIVLQEPSVVAIALNENKIVAVGNDAREMLGRTPETIEVARPLRDGVIADYVVTEAMLRYFIEKVAGRFRLFKPLIAISVPVGVTSVESRAVHDAAVQAGGRDGDAHHVRFFDQGRRIAECLQDTDYLGPRAAETAQGIGNEQTIFGYFLVHRGIG